MTEDGEDYYAIYEVYYDAQGRPQVYANEPCTVCTSSVEELQQEINRLQEALNTQLLTIAEFPREL
jgi:hypothetical protein